MFFNASTNEFVLRIKQLDISSDTGEWRCSYDNETSSSKMLYVYSKFISVEKLGIIYLEIMKKHLILLTKHSILLTKLLTHIKQGL